MGSCVFWFLWQAPLFLWSFTLLGREKADKL